MVAFLDYIVGKIRGKRSVDVSEKKASVYTKDILVGPLFEIGDYTYGRPNVLYWDDSTMLHIGKFCSIAEGVTILLGGNHRTDWVTTYPFNILSTPFPKASSTKGHPATKGDVWIGNDIWIGRGATILSGVHIGDGAVIGAGAIVTNDVAPYSVVVGCPAKEVKKRFTENAIKALLEIKWWEWDEDKINNEIELLCSGNIYKFIEHNQQKK